jgi:hypothetical protein
VCIVSNTLLKCAKTTIANTSKNTSTKNTPASNKRKAAGTPTPISKRIRPKPGITPIYI